MLQVLLVPGTDGNLFPLLSPRTRKGREQAVAQVHLASTSRISFHQPIELLSNFGLETQALYGVVTEPPELGFVLLFMTRTLEADLEQRHRGHMPQSRVQLENRRAKSRISANRAEQHVRVQKDRDLHFIALSDAQLVRVSRLHAPTQWIGQRDESAHQIDLRCAYG